MHQLNKLITITSVSFMLLLNAAAQPDTILLKNFRPKSIYKIPVTNIEKAKFPIIDMHSHPYATTTEDIQKWIKTMDRVGVEKSLILTYATGARFDSIYKLYSPFGNRFEVWCGFDYTGYNEPGWSAKAVKELERCF